MEKAQNEKAAETKPEVVEEEEPPSKLPQIRNRIAFKPIPEPQAEKDKPKISPKSLDFLQKHFPTATEKEWCSWQWQLRNSYTDLHQLQQILHLSDNEVKPLQGITNSLPIRITPYYASLIDPENPEQPIRRSVIPVFDEFIVSKGERSDPLYEEHDSPVPNIVHRYPDRVLFLVTGFCSTYCRYCTRSHMVAKDKCHIGVKAWEPALQYIENTPSVRDVLISGGDPLTMPDLNIAFLLNRLHKIPHVEMIRIGTKVPAVLPQRITRPLINILKRYHPLYLSIHFTHPDELTPEVRETCEQLANAGIPLGSQTVLLKGVNDDVETMKMLMHGLLRIRVRPYYLYQCDPILGSSHFRTPVSKGIEIIEGLRGHTTGYAVPQYVIDAPGGGGKIPILPEYYLGKNDDHILLRNYENRHFEYPDACTTPSE
ncbi:MAG: KamA family radical SAM protein [Bacteroidetes bacterium]|nr:KamA family radical SAM protein [Bacteroidota bacterium]